MNEIYEVNVVEIYCKESYLVKNIIDKTLINIPVILESENNQWYDVKYIGII